MNGCKEDHSCFTHLQIWQDNGNNLKDSAGKILGSVACALDRIKNINSDIGSATTAPWQEVRTPHTNKLAKARSTVASNPYSHIHLTWHNRIGHHMQVRTGGAS